jgi:hypothetical protein
MENEDPVRPGDERFKKLSNGVKGPHNKVLATRLVIASTGAMLTVGHEAPCRISALACRIESRIRIAKAENSGQVSGTSDASKTQLGLIRSWPWAAPSNGPEKRYIRAALKAKPGGAIVAVMVN